MAAAGHAEYGHAPEFCVITPVACPVPERADGAPKLSGPCRVVIRPGSRLFEIFECGESEEEYFCNYEVNPRYLPDFEAAGLRLVAFDDNGEVRAVELSGHRFFIATLFLPQDRAEQPHPLVLAYLEAARQCCEAAG